MGADPIRVVFENILNTNPLFFLNKGDIHYFDIAQNDRTFFRSAFDSLFTAPRQQALYENIPIAYVWDDHDFGPNNSGSNNPAKPAAQVAYREYVPHHALVAGPGANPIYQAFSVGRVRFILSDMRSESTPRSAPDDETKTLLGETQKTWLKKELLEASASHALVVWVSSVPWMPPAKGGSDNWSSYDTERREIARFIQDHAITNLLMLSGDAHMVALDDGRNNNFADGSSPGFPVFHAAALDRPGSMKGGTFSHGAFPGTGQYGLVEITDTGGPTVQVSCTGFDSANAPLLQHTFEAAPRKNK